MGQMSGKSPLTTPNCSLGVSRYRLLWKQLVWHLNGTAGPSIRWRITLLGWRYAVGVSLATRVCRGNKHGDHTDAFMFEPTVGHCLCARTRRRLDYIPF